MSSRLSLLGPVTATVLAAGGLTACGTTTGVSTGNLSGDSRLVGQTISSLQSDAQSRNNQKICDNDLATALVTKLTAGGRRCASVISDQLNEVDSFDLSLDGASAITVKATAKPLPTATARVKSTSANKTRLNTLTLVKEGTRWKISGLGS